MLAFPSLPHRQGYTCAQLQALPANLRSAEDAAMLQLSAKQQWKQCPKCMQMVERSEGCNHMLCRCGSGFCYKCGQPYKDKKPAPGNVHGTPACGCALFDVPEDNDGDEDDANGAPAAAPQDDANGAPAAAPQDDANGAPAAAPPRPWRGGRIVSRRRCRYSASIYGCPKGPGKCWFWHDEDDE
jgi:hypothetical protein